MVTSNVIRRVFNIRYDGNAATAFTVDVDKRQYLITAKHCVEGFSSGYIEIYHEKCWKSLKCNLIGHSEGIADISVLAAETQLSPELPLPPTGGGIVLGQNTYFLGFP